MPKRTSQFLVCLCCLSGLHADPLDTAWKDEILPIIDRYCFDCHGEGIDKGELDLEDYPDIFSMRSDRSTWKRIRAHLNQQLMPPIDEDQPSAKDREKIAAWIDSAVFPVDPEHPDPGRVTLRRLNRNEYQNTLRDLLALPIDVRELLPPDDSGYGFDNIGDVLTLSPAHLERFLEAARIALDQALHPEPMEIPAITIPGGKLNGPGRRDESGNHLNTNGSASAEFKVPAKGHYRVTIRAGGTPGGEVSPDMALLVDGKKRHHWTVPATTDQPLDYSFELHFEKPGNHRIAAAFTNDFWDPDFPDPKRRDRNLSVAQIKLIGPLDGPRPPKPASHQQIFGQRSADASDQQWATEILRRFARRAFRRPPHPGEAERYLHFVRLAKKQGQDVEHGIRLALEAMLVSPAFLYREEPQQEPDNAKRIQLIGQHSLASRLSYFLWSTMPDERLLKLADNGQLRTQLDSEIERMLASPKATQFIENFAGQWLQLRDLPDSAPSPSLFPDFDKKLLAEMRRETEMLFAHMIRENRPITELLDANYTFANASLAKHYRIPNIEGDEFRRVPLGPKSQRRGILSHGSLLVLTSHPTRTSPVLRGKFVLENLLGTAAPPAPPNVPQLAAEDPANRGLTQRQLLEKHRQDPACASCHSLMDPIGFGLEHFAADGSWRKLEDGKPIDASGKLISGREFSGSDELLDIILSDHREDFTRALATQMLTYALGRGTDWFDKPAIDSIVRKTQAQQFHSRALIKAIIHSVPFQYRRGDH